MNVADYIIAECVTQQGDCQVQRPLPKYGSQLTVDMPSQQKQYGGIWYLTHVYFAAKAIDYDSASSSLQIPI